MSECCVCYETYTASIYEPLGCKHCICDECYKKLPSGEVKCPMCRVRIHHRPMKATKRTTIKLSDKGIENDRNLTTYYDNIVERIVANAIREYNSSMTNDKAGSYNIEMYNYYYNKTDKSNDKPKDTFNYIATRVNTALWYGGLIGKIKCSLNSSLKLKGKDKDNKYLVAYDFAFST